MKVHVKVWTTGIEECETFVFSCGAGRDAELVSRFVQDLIEKFPGNKFKTVPLGKGRYNVIPQPQANA